MGYYTRFTAKVTDPKDGQSDRKMAFETVLKLAREFDSFTDDDLEPFKPEYIAKMKTASIALEKVDKEILEFFEAVLAHNADETKWYDHEDDMKAISKALPEFLFELHGEGEEAGDIWTKWFCRGKMQGGKAKVILPALDLKAF